MASEGKSAVSNSTKNGGKPKKRKYLPHAKGVRKGAYPLRPGVQGFFITCDGGRERQAAHEAISLLDNFCEELTVGENPALECKKPPVKPLNKKIRFEDSDTSSDDDNSNSNIEDLADENKDGIDEHSSKRQRTYAEGMVKIDSGHTIAKAEEKNVEEKNVEEIKTKEDTNELNCLSHHKNVEKSVDELIEDELKELGDRNKRRFVSLDSGCNGVIFIQMHKRAGQLTPSRIAEQMLSLAASTKKHMSRFILRILPVEVSCYASEEEITKAIQPLVSEYFPSDAPNPVKFAVLYDARANTGVDRMTIINAIAKSVPQPHRVDLSNPDLSIIVQIVKTVGLVGVVKQYKELAKYNLRQLTAPPTK